jgi:hypothetical protein
MVEGKGEWVSLFNLSGQMDGVMFEPVPIRDVTIALKPLRAVTSVRTLRSGETLDFSTDADGMVTCVVPSVNDYEFVVLEY